MHLDLAVQYIIRFTSLRKIFVYLSFNKAWQPVPPETPSIDNGPYGIDKLQLKIKLAMILQNGMNLVY